MLFILIRRVLNTAVCKTIEKLNNQKGFFQIKSFMFLEFFPFRGYEITDDLRKNISFHC